MNTKICTSIEQSKKLLSLGLDPSTADMYYSWVGTAYTLHAESYNELIAWRKYYAKTHKHPSCRTSIIPCWSFGALLELMPDIIKVEEEYYTFSLIKNVIEYVGHDGNILYSTGGESFVDAAVKMFELIDNSKNIH